MTRFTARAFRRRISKKTRRSKKGKRHTRRRQRGGGDTFSREIPKNAVIANVPNWDD